jgi:hypothetical protein
MTPTERDFTYTIILKMVYTAFNREQKIKALQAQIKPSLFYLIRLNRVAFAKASLNGKIFDLFC